MNVGLIKYLDQDNFKVFSIFSKIKFQPKGKFLGSLSSDVYSFELKNEDFIAFLIDYILF
jgi:hypothetical protein